MKCPNCGYQESKVIDSRPSPDNNTIKRRRECLACQRRFTTFEMVEVVSILVIKKDGTREPFDKSKLLSGVRKATYKCKNVNPEAIVDDIEAELQNTLRLEISTKDIGEMVLLRLKKIDEVAYVRFASVYREFQDIESFFRELRDLREEQQASVPEEDLE